MATDTKVSELIINKLTKAQYDSATKNPNELYLVKDAKITADDLDDTVLADYVKNTDYANTTTGGVVKTGATYGTQMASSGVLTSVTRTYDQYTSGNNAMFIGKATLENVITGKGLVSNTDYAVNNGAAGVVKVGDAYGIKANADGVLYSVNTDFATYNSSVGNFAISKGTLENVITGKGLVASEEATKLKVLSQEEYEALTPADDTIYFIKED